MSVTRPPSPQGRRKEAARRLLEAFDLGGVERWAAEERQALRTLQSFLFDADELLRWRAVEAIGRAAAVRAREDVEGVRELIRRTLWLMNDESGGLLWHGPQVVGSVLANVPALSDEFGDILASFLEEEPFRAGTRWALGRLAASCSGIPADATARLEASLADADPAVRGHAALALRACRGDALPGLADDLDTFETFEHATGELRTMTVAEAARAAT